MPRIGSNIRPRRSSSLALAAGIACLALAVALAVPAGGSQATGLSATAPGLGAAVSFAVLGGTTVTNSGPTIVNGDLGVSPGSSVTGFPPGIVNGTIHAGDALALQAQNDVIIAYNLLTSQPCDVDLTGQDLGGMTLVPGVYCFSSSAQLTGILTLDAQGDPLAVWVFLIGSTLTTGPGSSVGIINGGDPCNVFWQVGSSATLDTTTTFVGNILALTSIAVNDGVTVSGRLLARNGAVTLINDSITVAICTQPPLPTDTPIVLPTDTPIVTATNTPIPAPTNTPIPAPTNTPQPQPTEAPPTGTPIAGPTETPLAPATATPLSILPETGVGPALGSRQLLAAGLGFLGVGLVVFGFALRRRRGT